MLVGMAIERPPGDQPQHAEQAGDIKGDAPVEHQHQEGDEQRRHDRADIGAGVEQADRESTLLLRETVGHRADSGRKIARFADAERAEEHTSELHSLIRSSYAVFCLKKKKLIMLYQ